MKVMKFAAAAAALGMSVWMTGCMSMDEMLASDNSILRDIGERQAVSFAIDGANPLEKRLEVVPKISDQNRLAEIVIAKNADAEVKAEARKRIDKTSALAVIALNAPVREDQADALRQITKSEAARIEAAWIFAAHKSSAKTTETLLKGLSDDGKVKFAASFNSKVDEAAAAGDEAERLRQKFGDRAAAVKVNESKAILGSLVKLAPFVEDEKTLKEILGRNDVAAVKGTEYDFATPLECAYRKSVAARLEREAKAEAERRAREAKEFLAALTDKECLKLLAFGKINKDGKTAAVADAAMNVSLARNSADENVHKIPRGDIIKNIKDPKVLEKAEKIEKDRIAREEEQRKREEERRQREMALNQMRKTAFDKLVNAGILKDHDINRCGDHEGDPVKKFELAAEYLGKVSYYEGTSSIKKWMKAIELFKDAPELQQDLAEAIFNHAYSGFDDEQKLAELKKVIAVMPQDRAVEIFRSNITDKTVKLEARAIAYGITDQAVLKKLLVDDDSWARPRTKRCDWQRRKNVYATLLSNVKDSALADKIFCETRPTKNTEVITVGDILTLVDRLSESKRMELTNRAFACAEEAAKSTVVVKQYYVGMSYLDYALINFSNGRLSAGGLSRFDDSVSRKMTHIGFTKENRIMRLDIPQSNVIAACRQFAEKYGKVPDGKDVSGKTDVVNAIRTKEAFSDSAPGGTEYSNNSVWKWIDYVHDIQAEISTGSGNLVLCKAEIEGEFNHKNVKSEQQAAVIDAYASLASDDEDNDMGADPGLEPVGK